MVLCYCMAFARYVLLIHLTVVIQGFARLQFQQEDSTTALLWAVKLDMQTVARDHVLFAADIVASDTGLRNLGQIGGMFNYFAMAYYIQSNFSNATHSDFEVNPLTCSSLSDGQKANDKNEILLAKLSAGLHADVVNEINQKLDQHSFVEWQAQQHVLIRSRRKEPDLLHLLAGVKIRRADQSGIPMMTYAVHFSDPLFSKQWHLVSN
jgi:hypothetical protein